MNTTLRWDSGKTPIPALSIFLLGSILGVMGAYLPVVEWADLALYDQMMNRIPGKPPVDTPTLVVKIDDASLARFEEPLALWHEYLATSLQGLARAGARGVALDLIPAVSLERFSPDADRKLMRALQSVRQAGVPVYFGFGAGIDGVLPHRRFLFLGSGLGFLNLFPDGDGKIRRQRLFLPAENGRESAAMAWRMASLADPALPLPTAKSIHIDYRLPPPAEFSFVTLYDWAVQEKGGELRATFRDKLVFIGIGTSSLQNDIHRIPVEFGPSRDLQITGVHIQANLVNNLLSGHYLKAAPASLVNALVWLATLFSGWVFLYFRLRWACLTVLITWCGLLLLAGLAFHVGWVIPVAGAIPALLLPGLCSGAYRAMQRDSEIRQALEAEKLSALGQLVAGMAHEINTPIGVTVTAASFLKQQANELDAAMRNNALKKSSLLQFVQDAIHSLVLMEDNLSRASNLVRNFKQIAGDQSQEVRREFEVKIFLDEFTAALHSYLGQHACDLRVNCPEGLMLDSFPGALYQVFQQLIANVIQHAYPPEAQKPLEIDVSSTSGGVCIRLRDHGVGIADKHQKHVFEPFFTTRRGAGATGLGLHLAYNLVTHVLMGHIRCKSRPEQGTEFLIELPQKA